MILSPARQPNSCGVPTYTRNHPSPARAACTAVPAPHTSPALNQAARTAVLRQPGYLKNTRLKPTNQASCKEPAADACSQCQGTFPCWGLSRNSVAGVRLRGRRRAGARLPWHCCPQRELAVGRAASLEHAAYPRAHPEEDDAEQSFRRMRP